MTTIKATNAELGDVEVTITDEAVRVSGGADADIQDDIEAIEEYNTVTQDFGEGGVLEDGDVQFDEYEPADVDEKTERVVEFLDVFGFDIQSERDLQGVQDIETDDYPDAAVENARMALRWKEETGNPNDCGTQVGWERANQLDNGEDLSEDTINRMVSFFSRHEATQEPDEPKTDCSRMMWKAWGGDEGFRWAESKQDEFTNAREASAGKEEWEHTMRELFDRVWAEDTDKELLEFSNSQVPEFVKTRLRETILSGDAVFSDIESLAGTDLMDFRTQLADGLTQDGWTLGDITGRIMDIDEGISREQAETVARTETAAAVNTAREQAYEETGMAEGEKFYWTGATQAEQPERTTDACDWLIQKTNPRHNGTPVSLSRLRELIAEAPTHDPDMQDDLARPENYVVHPNERKTYSRAV